MHWGSWLIPWCLLHSGRQTHAIQGVGYLDWILPPVILWNSLRDWDPNCSVMTLFYLVAKLVGGEGEDGKVARELEESMLVFKNIFRIGQCSFMIYCTILQFQYFQGLKQQKVKCNRITEGNPKLLITHWLVMQTYAAVHLPAFIFCRQI